MARLTEKQKRAVPKSQRGIPSKSGTGSYPMPDKAHARNAQLLRTRATGGAVRGHWTDTLVVAGAFVVLLAALALPIVVAVWLWRLLGRALGG